MKFVIRKLLFLLAIVSMGAAPFVYVEYKSLTTKDPFILMARDIEDFRKGEVDVLTVQENPELRDGITTVVYIKNYPEWSVRQDIPNFNRHVLRAIAKYNYTAAVIAVGWDFLPKDFRVQGVWICPELRRGSCEWEKVPSVQLNQEFIQWPGIGNP